MRYLFALAILTLLIAFPAYADEVNNAVDPTQAEQTVPVWFPEEGAQIDFEVLRKGKPFGRHVLTFSPQEDGTLQVENDIELTAKIGPFTAYKYRHTSTETWSGGRLTALEGETRKDGDDLMMTANVREDELFVEGSNYTGRAPADIIPSSHWHSTEVFSDEILSSEGGQLLDVQTENMGTDTVTVAGEDIETTKFKLVSDLTVYLWYDTEGRWVKCAFEARGQTIEYILQALY